MDDLWVVLPHLGAGGAQKVALLAADHFASQGYRVRVLTLTHGHPVAHRLPPGVEHMDIGPDLLHPWLGDYWNRSLPARGRRFCIAQLIKLRRWVIKGLLWLLWPWIERRAWPGETGLPLRLLHAGMARIGGHKLLRLRELFVQERPRRVLALLTRTNILCCNAAWDLPIHLVVSERNDPSRQKLEGLWARLRLVHYRRADVVTANTEGVLRALQAMGHWRRLELLPNPLPAGVGRGGAIEAVPQQRELLAVARLVHQKGLDLLIRALASLGGDSTCADWRLVLVGDGPERAALAALAAREGVADRVLFEGFKSDPVRYMARASVFVLPSRFEGMPNALLEAMASGLAVVVSDASPGPLEMVDPGVNGLVVPSEDVEALADALGRLMADQALRERLGAAARQRLRSLDWDVVEPHWRSVLALPALP
ncbi:glycosyltransferase [Synechococcus sp. CCY 9618]|uniref:glycosyltransferase n=1 Tax=Synechococcus sp. CCY 9618 TaxID=2815602 RepID=UPI001C21567C|nr:glycosyltransferase [Synechococcus sp. CCY 9618]